MSRREREICPGGEDMRNDKERREISKLLIIEELRERGVVKSHLERENVIHPSLRETWNKIMSGASLPEELGANSRYWREAYQKHHILTPAEILKAIGRLADLKEEDDISKELKITSNFSGEKLRDGIAGIWEKANISKGIGSGFKLGGNVEESLKRFKQGGLEGEKYGLKELDQITGGLRKGEVTILAGRPSMGKTALMLSSGIKTGIQGGKVVIFSIEMSAESLETRAICSISGIKYSNIVEDYSYYEKKITKSLELLSCIDIVIYDAGMQDPNRIHRTLLKECSSSEVNLVIIDYLQLMSSGKKTENRNVELGIITRKLKEIAKEYKVPILLLSQLNRSVEQRSDKRPVLSDLRDSGSIEQDADVVLMMYRPDYYSADSSNLSKTEIIVGKNRNGPTGIAKVIFNKSSMSFESFGA